MNVDAILAHTLSIAHGVGASIACVACFYVGGLALVPRRWDESVGRGESPAVVGAALYVILCWFGISYSVPLTHLAVVFAGAVLVLAAARYRWIVAAFKARAIRGRDTLRWLLTFVVLYVLAYLFTMPPATAAYLPPAWTGNVDLLTYVNYARYLLRLGPSNLAGFTYLNFVYLQTPAVFYVLGWLSLLFGQQPLSAAMPAQFALTALIGVFAARISRSVFTVSRTAALAIACILISGPFFRYVAGAYFLSTLMSTPILLYLLWTTVSCRSSRLLDLGLAIRFGSAYVLLLFMYPFLLFVGLAAQAAAIVLTLVAEAQSRDRGWRLAWRDAGRNAGKTTCSVLLPLGLLALCFFGRLAWSINMVRSLSQAGAAGWPLDIISPLAVLGLPGMAVDHGHIEVSPASHRVWAVAAFCAVALSLGFLYFWRFRERTTPAQRTLAGLAGGASLLYCAYFGYFGPSYQQWKFASYSILPLSFVVFAGGLHVLQRSGPFDRATRTAAGRRVATALLGLVAAGLVGGNLLIHAQSEPALVRLPGALRNLATVDALPFFRELSVQMNDSSALGQFLAIYFLPNKRVHMISSSFRPNEPLSLDQISRQRPLLIQEYSCEGIGHGDTITVPGVGCLLLAPPSLALATSYPFKQTFLFVRFEGLGPRESQGRWNGRSQVMVELTADLRRAWVYQDTYVNLLLNPYIAPGTPRQRLVFTWGSDEHGEVVLDAREWISLPVGRADWTGNRLWKLPVTVAFPDGAASHWVESPEGRYKETRPLAVMFEDLSVSVSPGGRVVTPIVGAAR